MLSKESAAQKRDDEIEELNQRRQQETEVQHDTGEIEEILRNAGREVEQEDLTPVVSTSILEEVAEENGLTIPDREYTERKFKWSFPQLTDVDHRSRYEQLKLSEGEMTKLRAQPKLASELSQRANIGGRRHDSMFEFTRGQSAPVYREVREVREVQRSRSRSPQSRLVNTIDDQSSKNAAKFWRH